MEIKIIPAIDTIGGRCVRLVQGDYSRCTTYNADPLESAKKFEGCGIEMLHLVDLDGAKAQEPKNLAILEKIATKTSLKVEFGGGIKSRDAIKSALNAGAYRVICGSTACNNPKLFVEWLGEFGGDKLVFGADLKDGVPATHGWTKSGEIPPDRLFEIFIANGLKHSIVTDIGRDGMLLGPSTELYKMLKENFSKLNIIASGGISSITDLYELEKINITEAIVGKALYEGKISLNDLYNLNK
ncbi:MAG: 1-(5-phosphoribosyl)-5-[(5-phosphoribosylamino)methylideneamino]imidazole-4-carboxamide isomerase [Bacteroidales bacterium]|nr:1-(5-phosphoribosyl)-5-[(5-phosphoribosylamino)methylideneamino]imidazole-4-carboxamide isomerase [Bacteroidales bacterium]